MDLLLRKVDKNEVRPLDNTEETLELMLSVYQHSSTPLEATKKHGKLSVNPGIEKPPLPGRQGRRRFTSTDSKTGKGYPDFFVKFRLNEDYYSSVTLNFCF